MMLGFLSQRGVVGGARACVRGLLLLAIVLVGLAIEPAQGAQFVAAITAEYMPDDDAFAASRGFGAHWIDVAQATVEIVSDAPDPSELDQPYDVVVHVAGAGPGTPAPTGSVMISDASFSCFAEIDGNGNAGCSVFGDEVGTETWIATYFGDTNYEWAESASEAHTVARASTTVTLFDWFGNSAVTQPVTFFVQLDSALYGITGVVAIGDGVVSCTAEVDGGTTASCDLAFAHVGEHQVTASYGGDATHAPSISAAVSHFVDPAQTRVSIRSHTPDPSTPTQPVTVTVDAFVEPPGVGAPTGPILVTGSFGQQDCTIAQSGGSCELTLVWRGPQELMAQYVGNEDFNVSFDFAQHRVNELPFVFGESYASNEDATLSVESFQGLLINDSDEDGDRLTVVNTGPQAATGIGGTVTLNADGSFSYAPPPDAFGEAAFDYIVSDGYETVSASATLTVNPVNDPPSFTLAASPKWPANTSGDLITFSFATPIDFGPNENNSVLAWHVRIIDDPNGMLSGEATIGGDGNLYYSLSGHGGVATLGVTLQDDGGTANGGNDTSLEQTFTITVGFGADLSIAIDDGTDFAVGGEPLLYMITVRNLGPDRVDGARVYETLSNLVDATWVCTPSAGASCATSGSGSIEDYVNMPSGATLVYELTATVLASPELPTHNFVSVTSPAGVTDFNADNDWAEDIDVTGIFADGFDTIGDAYDEEEAATATRR